MIRSTLQSSLASTVFTLVFFPILKTSSCPLVVILEISYFLLSYVRRPKSPGHALSQKTDELGPNLIVLFTVRRRFLFFFLYSCLPYLGLEAKCFHSICMEVIIFTFPSLSTQPYEPELLLKKLGLYSSPAK